MKWYPPTFRETVTLLNRRDGKDSPDHLDAWKKTVLRNCVWTQQQTRTPSTQQTRTPSTLLTNAIEVKLSASYLARVPASPDYRPYHEWRADMDGFTFSTGDYLILGEIPEDVTLETVMAIVEKYRPDAFEVQLFKDNTAAGFLEHFRLEGK